MIVSAAEARKAAMDAAIRVSQVSTAQNRRTLVLGIVEQPAVLEWLASDDIAAAPIRLLIELDPVFREELQTAIVGSPQHSADQAIAMLNFCEAMVLSEPSWRTAGNHESIDFAAIDRVADLLAASCIPLHDVARAVVGNADVLHWLSSDPPNVRSDEHAIGVLQINQNPEFRKCLEHAMLDISLYLGQDSHAENLERFRRAFDLLPGIQLPLAEIGADPDQSSIRFTTDLER
jgi:hypothetical protein